MKQTLLSLSIVCCISAATEAQAQGISHVTTAGYPVPGNGSFPSGFAVFNGKLYFSAQDSAHGFELWSYDEKSPAKLVYDLNPDTIDGTAKNTYTTVYKNKLYLGAADTPGASRMRLFAYDGTNPRRWYPILAQDFITAPTPANSDNSVTAYSSLPAGS